ncbi:IclR family transcriptional regulator [Sphingobium sp. SCG-1]|uniref:IclR family transcriptional regulator n=1 Tax=Sphingobium sp. SCG-1 TaxID=2072936 RepID=UPI000CD677E2|nr:IclR family transcriptional regulator C-terminal domain-containing protein [Sphingobium sp. SCG-1]AUW57093.1 IclR family transcriptional regulator [Sphingobium sp. SCG-1]
MSSSDRMLAVLSLFSLDRREVTVEEAAELLGSSLRTTYRYVRSLAAAGLLSPMRGGRYVLGPAAVQLDWLIRNTDPLTSAAGPAMSILANTVQIPAVILLCRLYKNQVMCISQLASGLPPFASSYQRGRPIPLFRGAASKSILASMPKRLVRQFYSQHREEMAASGLGVSLLEVHATLSQIREAGVCTTSSELDVGLTGLAAPLIGADSLPVGSLSIVVAEAKLTPDLETSVKHLLKAGANQVSGTLQAL